MVILKNYYIKKHQEQVDDPMNPSLNPEEIISDEELYKMNPNNIHDEHNVHDINGNAQQHLIHNNNNNDVIITSSGIPSQQSSQVSSQVSSQMSSSSASQQLFTQPSASQMMMVDDEIVSCVVCHAKDIATDYSTKTHLDDYRLCFSDFDGRVGPVCTSCYGHCYAFRKKKAAGEEYIPKKTNLITATTSTTTATITPGKRPRGRPRKNGAANPPRKTAPRGDGAPRSRQKICCCCNTMIDSATKSYNYAPYRRDYAELFPSSIEHSSRRVCEECYNKCQEFIQGREDELNADLPSLPSGDDNDSIVDISTEFERPSKRSRRSIRSSGFISDDNDDTTDADYQPQAEKPRLTPTSSSRSKLPLRQYVPPRRNEVDIFLAFKFIDGADEVAKHESIVDNGTVIRCTVPSNITISDLKKTAQLNLEQLLSTQIFEVVTVRRIGLDSIGKIIEETLFQETIFDKYPLAQRERLAIDVKLRAAMLQQQQPQQQQLPQ